MTPDLSVVVVAWRSGSSLATCVTALRDSARAAGASLELAIVENGSGTDAADAARRLEPEVLIANPVNAGFGVAASQGLSRTRADWVMLVNPDVVVDAAFVEVMLREARRAPDAVSTLVPDIRFAASPEIVNCRGIAVDETGIPFELGTGRPAERLDEPTPVFGASTGCAIYRRSALEAVGGLEVAFFAYLEDVDLAWRLRRAGYVALLVPGAVALHETSATTGEGSRTKAYLVARSRRLLFALDGPRTPRARVLRTIADLGHALVVTTGGGGRAPWAGRAAALGTRRYIRFVLRSRGLEAPRAQPRLVPRVGMFDTLRRKRRVRAGIGGGASDDG